MKNYPYKIILTPDLIILYFNCILTVDFLKVNLTVSEGRQVMDQKIYQSNCTDKK